MQESNSSMSSVPPIEQTDQPSGDRKTILFIFVMICLDLLCAGMVIPVIPALVGQFNQNALAIGLLAVTFYSAQFIATPALGVLSDRHGRRPILLLCILGTGVAYFLFGAANALWLLFLGRLIDGVTGGNISVALAYISDVSSPETRAKNFGLIGAAFGIGFIIGPAVGGFLSLISLQTPALAAGVLSVIITIFGFFLLPESLAPEQRRKKVALAELNPLRQVRDALRPRILRRLLLSNFAQNFAFSGLQTNFVLYTFVRYGLDPAQNGLIFAYIGFLSGLMQGVITGILVERFRERRLAAAGLALMMLGYAALALAPEVWSIYGAMTLIAVGSGLSTPTLTSIITKQVSSEEQGSILGASQAIDSIALMIGPVWAGLAFDYLGPTSPYWTGAVWLLIAVLFVAGAYKKRKLARKPLLLD
jgi:DHA1 family tetracycline resistance protein-like MFS transporter